MSGGLGHLDGCLEQFLYQPQPVPVLKRELDGGGRGMRSGAERNPLCTVSIAERERKGHSTEARLSR